MALSREGSLPADLIAQVDALPQPVTGREPRVSGSARYRTFVAFTSLRQLSSRERPKTGVSQRDTAKRELMNVPRPTISDSGFARFRASLNKGDRTSIRGMYAFIVFLHLIGFGVLLAFVVPRGYNLGATGIYGVGVGVLAYTFGLRHAFDADHIAAVDNTTRKLMADNAETRNPRKPLSVGFWFSLGHSTMVFTLTFLLSVGVKALAGQVEDESSELHSVTGVIGASVSGVFLWILGILNLVVLIGIIRFFFQMRT